MASKRAGSFSGSVLRAAEKISGEDAGTYRGFYAAIRNTAFHELSKIGFGSRSIDRMVKNGRMPSDELIRDRIDVASQSNDAHGPLTLNAYKRCLWLLFRLEEYMRLAEDYESAEPPLNLKEVANLFFDIGLHLGMKCNLPRNPSNRQGKVYSVVQMAIDYAISLGHVSDADIRAYLDTEPEIDSINARVKTKNDRYGNTQEYIGVDSITGKEQIPVKLTSLASTISKVKNRRRKAINESY